MLEGVGILDSRKWPVTGKKDLLNEQSARTHVILKWKGASIGEKISEMVGRQQR